jgi:hypothetical protein
MNSLARYESVKNSNPGCASLITMAEQELSAFFNAVTDLFGSEQAEISAEDWLREFIEIDHSQGFDSACQSRERFVPIDQIHNCLGGKEHACICYRSNRLRWFRSRPRTDRCWSSGARPCPLREGSQRAYHRWS